MQFPTCRLSSKRILKRNSHRRRGCHPPGKCPLAAGMGVPSLGKGAAIPRERGRRGSPPIRRVTRPAGLSLHYKGDPPGGGHQQHHHTTRPTAYGHATPRPESPAAHAAPPLSVAGRCCAVWADYASAGCVSPPRAEGIAVVSSALTLSLHKNLSAESSMDRYQHIGQCKGRVIILGALIPKGQIRRVDPDCHTVFLTDDITT